MKPRDYCCCAIPVVNAGIYTTLLEQLALAITAGTLSIATPHIVGASTPTAASTIFAVICYVAAGVQILGIYGVVREKPILFRRYSTVNMLVTIAAFSVAAVWIIISAIHHSTAKTQCLTDYFDTSDSASSSEGNTFCNIFPWVDIGLMSGLWVLLAIMQLYLLVVISSYATGQTRDHAKYDSLYDPAKPLQGIPLNNRADPWSSRLSTDSLMNVAGGYHSRDASDASMATVMASKPEQATEFDPYRQTGYAPTRPENAVTEDPGPTPRALNSFPTSGYSGGPVAPAHSQVHPAEGSFRRKTPRLKKPTSDDYDLAFLSHRPV